MKLWGSVKRMSGARFRKGDIYMNFSTVQSAKEEHIILKFRRGDWD